MPAEHLQGAPRCDVFGECRDWRHVARCGHRAVEGVQKFIWSQGDYEPIACEAAGAAEELAAACGITAGDDVLDVGAGTGNAAIAAARRAGARNGHHAADG